MQLGCRPAARCAQWALRVEVVYSHELEPRSALALAVVRRDSSSSSDCRPSSERRLPMGPGTSQRAPTKEAVPPRLATPCSPYLSPASDQSNWLVTLRSRMCEQVHRLDPISPSSTPRLSTRKPYVFAEVFVYGDSEPVTSDLSRPNRAGRRERLRQTASARGSTADALLRDVSCHAFVDGLCPCMPSQAQQRQVPRRRGQFFVDPKTGHVLASTSTVDAARSGTALFDRTTSSRQTARPSSRACPTT